MLEPRRWRLPRVRERNMKQQCYLWAIWLTWLGVPVLVIVLGIKAGWLAGALVLLVTVVAQVAYIRWFPHLSTWLGYGSVADVSAESVPAPTEPPRVTLYTANVCPFCPLVRQRLEQLQGQMGFVLEELDVTFRPELVRAKGLRSVPVIEVDGRYWVGNATTAQLASFLVGE